MKKDDDDDRPSSSGKQRVAAESTTDPESGVFHKGEHKKCFAYEAHTVCDRRGYVLETEITPGNVHDSVAFDAVFERLIEHYPAPLDSIPGIASDSAKTILPSSVRI